MIGTFSESKILFEAPIMYLGGECFQTCLLLRVLKHVSKHEHPARHQTPARQTR